MTAALPDADLERRVRELEARLEEMQEYVDEKASAAHRRGDQLRFLVWRSVASELFEGTRR